MKCCDKKGNKQITRRYALAQQAFSISFAIIRSQFPLVHLFSFQESEHGVYCINLNFILYIIYGIYVAFPFFSFYSFITLQCSCFSTLTKYIFFWLKIHFFICYYSEDSHTCCEEVFLPLDKVKQLQTKYTLFQLHDPLSTSYLFQSDPMYKNKQRKHLTHVINILRECVENDVNV